MTEQATNPAIEDAPDEELQQLKERAKILGIRLGGNVSKETLKARIKERLEERPETEDTPAVVASPGSAKPKTKAQIQQEIREQVQAEGLKLVRCRIYNLNPSKRDLHGEIVTVANKYLGTVRKFIPFGEATDNGYHVPNVIYRELKARKFQHIQTKEVRGQIQVSTRIVPEYNIEVLPPLTPAELHELALKQAAAERLGTE